MNDLISIVFNPGRVYYDFQITYMQDLVDDWNGELLSSKKVVYFVEDDFRLQITPRGQITAFGIQLYKDSYSVKQLIEWSVPKVLGILKRNNRLFAIDQINIIYSILPEESVIAEQQKVCRYVKEILGSNLKTNNLSLDAGNHATIITGASLDLVGLDEIKKENRQRSMCR